MSTDMSWVFPGGYLGMVASDTLLLVSFEDVPVDDARVLELWRNVEGRASTADLLECLSGGALTNLPSFAVARVEGQSVRVLVRGELIVRVGDERIVPTGVSTWIERVVPMSDRIELAPEGSDMGQATGYLVSGVQRVGGLIRAAVPSLLAISAVEPAPEIDLEPEIDEGAAAVVVEGFEPDAEPGRVDDPAPSSDPDVTLRVLDVDDEEPESVSEEPAGYDHLFGATVRRTVEEAAVRDEEPEPDVPHPSTVTVSEVPGYTRDKPQPEPVADVVTTGFQRPLITAIPGGAPDTGVVDALAVPPAVTGAPPLTDDHTVRREQLPRPANAPMGLGSANAPKVQSVSCPAGHPNPPYADRCRVCGAGIGQLDPVTVPRPVLGVLRFATGESVPLARPLVMGRAPKSSSGGGAGGEMPVLFTVKSPQSDVSRTHLEIRIDGWHVLVVDLDSANGTTLTIPGQQPRRLHPGEPVTIPIGAQVTMADEVSFVYEASQ
jgi:hypothetical protein